LHTPPKEAFVYIPLSKRGLRLHTSLQKRPKFAYLSPKEAYVVYLSIKEPKEAYIWIPIEAKETHYGAKRGLRLILGHEPEPVSGNTPYWSLLPLRKVSFGKRDRYIFSPELLSGNAPVAVLLGFSLGFRV
jgi:hypothetical protein